MSPLILVIDDEAPIRELIRYNLVRAGCRVLLAESGEEAVVRGAGYCVYPEVLHRSEAGLA